MTPLRLSATASRVALGAILLASGGCDDRQDARADDVALIQTSSTASITADDLYAPPSSDDVTDGTRAPEPRPTLATPGSSVDAGQLPDGRYRCQIWIGNSLASLGVVEVRGGAYRGPSHNPGGPFTPLRIDGSGEIIWSPNFSQLQAAGATITRTVVTRTGFTVEYTTARGWRESMECSRE